MHTDLSLPSPVAGDSPETHFDFGTWLGRRQAFGAMAGKASAADIECLRQIRDKKLYKCKTRDFGEFCSKYIGASKSQINRLIHFLEKWGPEFFTITQLTRIPAESYQTIAPHVAGDHLLLDGVTIPLAQENSERISAAVAELRKRAASGRPPSQSRPTCRDVAKQLGKALSDLRALQVPIEQEDRFKLRRRVRQLGETLGMRVLL